MPPLAKRLRRWLYLGHRWLGILTCLLFAAWFVSGVVMMYVGFPRLTDAERRAALPPIAWDRVGVEPEDAVDRAGFAQEAVRRLDLAMLDTEPVYRITPWNGPRRTVSATDGHVVGSVSADRALAVARHHPASGRATNLGLVERDQWTVPQRFDPLRPFHRIALGDDADTHLYVSAVTGETALDTSRHERFWNWFGAVPHWIYFTPLRAQRDLWRDVVLWLSGLGTVGAVTGMAVGVMRVRLRRRYARGSVTPYRGWMAWHHLGGLVAGTTLVTFVASGWVSMNPNRWFPPREPDRAALARYEGRYGSRPPLDPAALMASCPQATEARFARFDGEAQILLGCDGGPTGACCGTSAAPSRQRIETAAARLLPDHPAPTVDLLTSEDLYWYSHHRERKLPVLRVRFTDPARTWFHIDPSTGEMLDRMDRSNRAYRWLFNAPHSFDFALLTRYRPAWDALVLLLSLGGLLVAVSGTVVAWRRLRLMGKGNARP
ncbi:PepSY domain-containing protein [Methylorubrum thiocyanatum]|uniref:Membrane protein n=1 Tax=Methylorubrum thiocyanatum TaxID=47958 RepID=A0AA40S557_9HYPH|nr:PepSY domain-containing protein [Methylorubrum thiocyanatum]MBA8914599.1 putative membrane protein [Methylorubrum thiocyanatum]GJE81988.1 hypothetical protein CJNNKLLH_3345 [Methylorubrum thiocyanatum]